MYLQSLQLENFRNYQQLHITLPEQGAVFLGSNGSGKTSILEAIHLLCTGKSQRNARRSDMVRHQGDVARVEGHFFSSATQTRYHCSYSFNRENACELRINGQKQPSFSLWYGTQPVVSFSPADNDLVIGGPDVRRRYIDMLISQVDKEYLAALILYRKNLLQRNSVLKSGGDDLFLSVYEQGMAENGETIVQKRAAITEELGGWCSQLYPGLCGGKEEFFFSYQPSFRQEKGGIKSWKNVFYTMLSDRRKRDRDLGFSSFGPHRDDLSLTLDQKPAKTCSSQGQGRTIALSLKLASLLLIEKKGGKKPIVLFDDAASELDKERTFQVYGYLHDRGQVLVASPHDSVSAASGVQWFYIGGNTAKPCLRCDSTQLL